MPNIINITCIHLKLGWLSKIFIRGIFANHKILAVFSNYCAYQCPSLSELESSTAHSSELLQATWPRSCTTPPSPGSPASPAQAAAPVAGPGLYFTLMDHQHPGYCSIQCGKFPNLNNRQVAHKMDAGIFINYHNSDHISFCSTARLCWCTAVPQ